MACSLALRLGDGGMVAEDWLRRIGCGGGNKYIDDCGDNGVSRLDNGDIEGDGDDDGDAEEKKDAAFGGYEVAG